MAKTKTKTAEDPRAKSWRKALSDEEFDALNSASKEKLHTYILQAALLLDANVLGQAQDTDLARAKEKAAELAAPYHKIEKRQKARIGYARWLLGTQGAADEDES